MIIHISIICSVFALYFTFVWIRAAINCKRSILRDRIVQANGGNFKRSFIGDDADCHATEGLNRLYGKIFVFWLYITNRHRFITICLHKTFRRTYLKYILIKYIILLCYIILYIILFLLNYILIIKL